MAASYVPLFGSGSDPSSGSGSGSSLDAILASVSQLGSAAITATLGPQNRGVATTYGNGISVNPITGQPLTTPAGTSSIMSIIVIVALVFGGIFLFKKL